MRGAIPPLPNTSSWRGAQLKYRDFTFYLHLYVINVDRHNLVEFSVHVFTGTPASNVRTFASLMQLNKV
jgi:hypothetical protein